MSNTISVKTEGYDRNTVKAGIMHIGVGNFHRAHEACYIDSLLGVDQSQHRWGICGVMLLDGDKEKYEGLKSQKGEYTLTECGSYGHDNCRRIGSEVELLWAPEDPEAVIERMGDEDIRIISMTITEGGYNINRKSGTFDLNNDRVRHDLDYPREPTTVFGYLAAGMRNRRDTGSGKVTILSCDNMAHNGDVARKAILTFIRAQDPELAEWVEENVTFPNSMVDRITPATSPADVERLNIVNGTDDEVPVYCEEFKEWVMEDTFANGRPDWEQVGVLMSNDVADYEDMKLGLLNASHTMMCYPAFLSGYRRVDSAIGDPRISKLVRDFMDRDATPYIKAPDGIDLNDYKHTLFKRFANRSVSDHISRLCSDGLSKFSVFIIPTLTKMITDGADMRRMAYLFAAYRHYLRHLRDDNGEAYEVCEPHMNDVDRVLIESDNALDFLNLEAFAGAGLSESKSFKMEYLEMVKAIAADGALATLERL